MENESWSFVVKRVKAVMEAPGRDEATVDEEGESLSVVMVLKEVDDHRLVAEVETTRLNGEARTEQVYRHMKREDDDWSTVSEYLKNRYTAEIKGKIVDNVRYCVRDVARDAEETNFRWSLLSGDRSGDELAELFGETEADSGVDGDKDEEED